MIPFVSQRGNGADLATHLANAEDNEHIEYETRGTIADDIQGAMAEMEIKQKALSNLKKGFVSLSINPDPKQQAWPKEWYYEYADGVEKEFGLEGHERILAWHIKQGADGLLREHCHAVWSRLDVENQRGVNISFDRLKLMAFTREFAQEKGIRLPDGYYKTNQNHEQTSLYEKVKENKTGISKEQHKTVVTDLWRTSDSPKAFVAGLEDAGFMLASGRRPYVLVDAFGNMHALPRLIDDRGIRTKDIEAFLRDDFPPESLSTVEEARAVATQLEDSRKRVEDSQKLDHQKEILQRDQDTRRDQLQSEITAKQEFHNKESARLSETHHDNLYVHKLNAAQQDMEIKFKRSANAPSGLAGFLSRVTGMDIVRSKLHAYQDRKREAIQEQARALIEEQNRIECLKQQYVHTLEMMEMRRLEREQVKSFEREQRSIVMAQEREKVAHYSKGYEHMPSVQLALTPRGRMAVPAKAGRRFYAPTVKEHNVKAKGTEKNTPQFKQDIEPALTPPPMAEDFTAAAEEYFGRGSGNGEFIASDNVNGKGRTR